MGRRQIKTREPGYRPRSNGTEDAAGGASDKLPHCSFLHSLPKHLLPHFLIILFQRGRLEFTQEMT